MRPRAWRAGAEISDERVGQPLEAVDKVPLGGFQAVSLETYCVGDTRQVLFLLNVREGHLDSGNDLVYHLETSFCGSNETRGRPNKATEHNGARSVP